MSAHIEETSYETNVDPVPRGPIDVFRDEYGMFSMVAVDQRGSLRHMLSEGRQGAAIADDELSSFKTDLALAIGDQASGLLLDQDYGLEAARNAQCPVILAADILSSSQPGDPMDIAQLDDSVTLETVQAFGAKALKFLLPWQPNRRTEAVELAHAFMERCREFGIPGVLEGVVRPREGHLESAEGFSEALIMAASDLSKVQPDLYKTEVLYGGEQDRALAVATAKSITRELDCPWVVLSSGVSAEEFPEAVLAAVTGGASGFLAGRAVWSRATRAADPGDYLRSHAPKNLQSIAERIRKTEER
ncbi:hypothetical protein [Glutamicibacter mishrai]|uniref:Aldolase n=1 Tax=Glutamicibacter mishrai TaxID=1775880 RepID=A0A6H0SJX6_9MICC|nr:hypothetical protein [Glutamicibacter mishrai]QIV86645.1 hypothetical protein D3791_05575 [Glutamicibacter mishrai]